jgi:hypothetical protein
MLEAGIARLQALRHTDAGFGWWPTDASDPAMNTPRQLATVYLKKSFMIYSF